MKPQFFSNAPTVVGLSRRQFVTGVAAGTTLLGLNACTTINSKSQALSPAPTLRGNTFDLSIDYMPVNFTGHERMATAVNGSLPAPILRWRQGDTVTLRVKNNLAEDSSIHWHGIILPANMDGVPGLSFGGIRPGETYHYQFKVQQSGTYWYHSHSGFQEQTGLYGAIVIDPADSDPVGYDRDYVVMLSDWSDENPARLYEKLKKQSHYFNIDRRTLRDLQADIKAKGTQQTWNDRLMWNTMRMSDRDLSDITGYTYTFLMNGQTPADGWLGLFNKGERVRLRVINGSAMTFFDVRIPGLKMTVVAADGQNIQPVTVDEFRIGVAEVYDVIVEPDSDMAYTVFAQAIDRSGYARGTLTSNANLQALIPAMDPAPLLTHQDMGMAHAAMGHNHGTMATTEGNMMDHSMMKQSDMDHTAMNHSQMDSSQMKNSNMEHPSMDHSMPHQANMNKLMMGSGKAGFGSATAIEHAGSEFGPQVDMRAQQPQYRLDDPGVGLRDHQQRYGRRVLTYADLHNLRPTPDPRQPQREIQLHLTGNMERYMWSINGVKFADAEPLPLKYGERVRITLVNDTMMNHPIHLHGMWSDLETGDGNYIPRKHTVIVQPGAKLSYLVTVDAKGHWAYHCHLLYHMLGMFREVVVS